MHAYRCTNNRCPLFDEVWFSGFSPEGIRLVTGRTYSCTACGEVSAAVPQDEVANRLLDEYDEMMAGVRG